MKGFTVVEALIAVGMLGILSMVLASFSVSAYGNLTEMDRNSAIFDSFEEVRMALSQPGSCSKNFGAKGVGFNQPIAFGVSYVNVNTGNLEPRPIFQINEVVSGVRVQDLRILQKNRIDDTLYLADLQLTYEIQSPRRMTVRRFVPLQVSMQGGIVQECWYRKVAASIAYNQVCYELSGGSLNAVDPVTGKCILAGGKWFPGTEQTARCPVGSYLPADSSNYGNCRVSYPAGFSDSFEAPSVALTDGSTVKLGRSAAILRLNRSTQTCTCDWAADLSSSSYSGAKCQILCIQP